MWEIFYSRIRHESSPEDAIKIVVRHLREWVPIAKRLYNSWPTATFFVMINKSTAIALTSCAVFFGGVVFLFIDGVCGSSRGSIDSALTEVAAVICDPVIQWMIVLCLGVYFTTFLFLRARIATGFWRAADPNLWLACALLISAVLYAIYYSPSTQALSLLGGAVLGQGSAVWAGFELKNRKSANGNNFGALVASTLVILLALASVWQTDAGRLFKYHNHARWSGPWDNPNIFGLLMGAGAALATGMAVRRWQMADGRLEIGDGRWKLGARKYAVAILFLSAVVLMARGLLHSYSRGAWLATGCGVTYLFWSTVCSPRSTVSARSRGSCVSWLNKNWLSLSAILISVVILSFWHFRQTEWHPAHRAFSVGNQNDFSWRNRIPAWEGALQMMADKPLFGAGWNRPEPMYDHYYRAPKVVEGMAIQLNDYLMFGATLGIPALLCFGMYVWLSLTKKSEIGNQKLEIIEADWSKTVCRAGAIVLIVGFWFDGGLFKFATASTFWILLELGA